MQSSPLKVGLRIKSIRKGLGLNQSDFAKKINATVPAVSNWENGRNLPNSERLKEIADLEKISVKDLTNDYPTDYELIWKELKKRISNASPGVLDKTLEIMNKLEEEK